MGNVDAIHLTDRTSRIFGAHLCVNLHIYHSLDEQQTTPMMLSKNNEPCVNVINKKHQAKYSNATTLLQYNVYRTL